jgi:hypothetical protein
MTTQEVANRLVQLCRQGKNADAINELFAANAVSIEPKGAPQEKTEGKANCLAKTLGWVANVETFHSSKISDPIVTSNYFACTWETDVTMKGMGRMQLNEVCVFGVENGKIVSEQFFFKMNK